jgi:hypothetical protein
LVLLIGVAALPPWSNDVRGQQPPGGDDWKFDIVVFRKRPAIQGLIVEESSTHVLFRSIVHKPGRPTLVMPKEWIPIAETERVDRLSKVEREELQRRLDALARERETLSAQLKINDPGAHPDKPDRLALDTLTCPLVPQFPVRVYRSTHFRLVSTGSDELTRLAAIHLEQVYAAHVYNLPPRVDPAKGRPTLILLAGSLNDYETLIRGKGLNFFNPAFYDVKNNQIVCGSDLQRLAAERDRIHERHVQLKADLEQRRTDLKRIYKGRVPQEFLDDIDNSLSQIKKTDKANDDAYNLARSRFFGRLYHESFHAYLSTWVYPESEVKVPVWLNEGLAQVFETAIVEVGELRVDSPDPERAVRVRLAVARDKWLPLLELLTSGSEQFLVNHAREQQVSDRYYLASWALAHYLAFERRLLGTRTMDNYVAALQRGTDPLDAFRELVGEPLPQFEKEYMQYLQRLPVDPRPGGK